MSFQIEMPQLSAEGESATLASWLVEAGDRVEAGEVIAELETDKATVELEAPVAGTVAELTVAAGTEGLAPGALLGIIDAEGDEEKAAAPARDDRSDAGEVAPPASKEAPPPPPASPAAPTSRPSEDPPSTPLARRVAAQRGLDLTGVAGSGAHGRILEADVLKETTSAPAVHSLDGEEAPAAKTAAPSSKAAMLPEERPHSTERLDEMRQTIARRMTESKQQVPHFYLSVRCRMDEVERTRAHLNEQLSLSAAHSDAPASGNAELSINDFVVKAAALAMRDVPAANVCFDGEAIRVFECVDIAVAVAIDGGLVTPVVRDADRKGLVSLSAELRDLAERAREDRSLPEPVQGGTLTISNLGAYGIETVYPILNPPQACILGVGAAEEQPIVIDGQVGIGRVAVLTLAADHRAIDGAVGAQWLAAVRRHLEDPVGMML